MTLRQIAEKLNFLNLVLLFSRFIVSCSHLFNLSFVDTKKLYRDVGRARDQNNIIVECSFDTAAGFFLINFFLFISLLFCGEDINAYKIQEFGSTMDLDTTNTNQTLLLPCLIQWKTLLKISLLRQALLFNLCLFVVVYLYVLQEVRYRVSVQQKYDDWDHRMRTARDSLIAKLTV